MPGIDALLNGINNPDFAFAEENLAAGNMEKQLPVEEGPPDGIQEHPNLNVGPQMASWNDFMSFLEEVKTNKMERLVCKLDRDLADTLDDCDIHNRSRSDLVNAIVRSFFKAYLPLLAEYRREKKSLLLQNNKVAYEKK